MRCPLLRPNSYCTLIPSNKTKAFASPTKEFLQTAGLQKKKTEKKTPEGHNETDVQNKQGQTREHPLTAVVPVTVGEQTVTVGERREVGGVESHFSHTKRGDPSSTYPQSHPRTAQPKTVLVASFFFFSVFFDTALVRTNDTKLNKRRGTAQQCYVENCAQD